MSKEWMSTAPAWYIEWKCRDPDEEDEEAWGSIGERA